MQKPAKSMVRLPLPRECPRLASEHQRVCHLSALVVLVRNEHGRDEQRVAHPVQRKDPEGDPQRLPWQHLQRRQPRRHWTFTLGLSALHEESFVSMHGQCSAATADTADTADPSGPGARRIGIQKNGGKTC
eukprot:scaffold1954_cov268-Pinguiococcus_pyrenoidosus.AAC.219